MKKITIALLATALLTAACSTTEKVSVVQPGDSKMSCAEMNEEFAKLDAVDQEAEDNKGVNGTNVAAAIVFPLAIVGNYLDAEKAEELSRDRRQHLVKIYEEKGC